jgi:flagellar protein FliT
MSPEQSPLLFTYQKIADTTSAMREAARVGNWSVALELGKIYCASVEKLRNLNRSVELDSGSRVMKHDLFISIIENDADTRDLAMPPHAGIEQLLEGFKRDQPLFIAARTKEPKE